MAYLGIVLSSLGAWWPFGLGLVFTLKIYPSKAGNLRILKLNCFLLSTLDGICIQSLSFTVAPLVIWKSVTINNMQLTVSL